MALDRVLQWNYYLVPNFTLAAFRIAYWNKFGKPDKRPDPPYSYGGTSWWVDPAKEAALAGRKNAEQPATETAQATTTHAGAGGTQPAPAQPAPATAPTDQPAAAADRGQSPLIYAGGAVVVVIVAYLLGRRRRKGS